MNAVKQAPQARIAADVLDHMLIRLAATRVEADPFPHFFAEEIFPQAIYNQLLAALPTDEQMTPLAEKHTDTTGRCTRFQMILHAAYIDRLSAENRAVWFGVQSALASPQLKRAVFAKLSEGLAYRYRIAPSAVSTIEGHPWSALMRETTGYTIAPHPDGRRKIVTMQFALPPDDSQADLGTTFYQRSSHPSDWLSKPYGFRTAKQMPFRPNCAYAFVVLNTWAKKSWHGREFFSGDRGTRNSILHLYRTEAEGESGY